jgi:phosphoenolpyruvate-protein kinase (PTS system EI component)
LEKVCKEHKTDNEVLRLDFDATQKELDASKATINTLEKGLRKSETSTTIITDLTKANLGLKEGLRTNNKVETDKIKAATTAATVPLSAEIKSLKKEVAQRNFEILQPHTQRTKDDAYLQKILREHREDRATLAASEEKPTHAVEISKELEQLQLQKAADDDYLHQILNQHTVTRTSTNATLLSPTVPISKDITGSKPYSILKPKS